jgi:hypothetical protein
VGPEREIVLLNFDYDTDSIIEINERLGPFSSDATYKYSNVRDPLREFWDKTETACVVGCCGLNAFNFWPEQIVDVVKDSDIETLVKQLERVKEQVLASDAQIVRYNRFNESFARVSFLEMMDYLITEVRQWL